MSKVRRSGANDTAESMNTCMAIHGELPSGSTAIVTQSGGDDPLHRNTTDKFRYD